MYVHGITSCLNRFSWLTESSHFQDNEMDKQGCTRYIHEMYKFICLCTDPMNLLKPTRIEFAENSAPSLSLPDGSHFPPKWLEYIYRTAHPVLRWLPTKLAGAETAHQLADG